MTKVDFYILQSNTEQARLSFTCRLLEKASRQGNKILVVTNDEAMSSGLDEMLWEFKSESYVPHKVLIGPEDCAEMPVAISHCVDSEHHHDVIVNLSESLPGQFSRFKRFAQVVNQAPTHLAASRQHFAFLKERGYPIEVNKLSH